jgi:hypothetical protein
MTEKINRYKLSEITTIRVRKKNSGKTLEIKDELLGVDDVPGMGRENILYDIRKFQELLEKIQKDESIEIELDFKEDAKTQ